MVMDMGSGLDWLGKMRRKGIHGCHGASLDGSKGVNIIRGHRTGFGKKERALGRDYPKVSFVSKRNGGYYLRALEASFGRAQSLVLENDWFMGMGEQRAIQAS